MRQIRLLVLSSMVTVALLPAPAPGQDWSQEWADPEDRPPRMDFSVSAGGVMPTSWSEIVLLGSISVASGVLEQVLTQDLRVESDTAYSAAVTYWRGRYGFRTQGGFSRSSLRVGTTPGGNGTAALWPASSVGVDTWFYDVRGAIGLVDYRPSRWVWPYGFIGAGGITYRLEAAVAPPLTFLGSGVVRADGSGNTVVVAGNGRQFLLAIDELTSETVFAVNFGIGADFRIPVGTGGLGLRVEVTDHVASSPLRVRIRELSPLGGFVPESGVGFPLVHHLSATVGVVVHIGG